MIVIKPGTRVPVDGVILTGESEIDRAFLTGESLPVYAGPDTAVSAGEINLTGPLTMRVAALSKDSALQNGADWWRWLKTRATATPRWRTRRQRSMPRACICWPRLLLLSGGR